MNRIFVIPDIHGCYFTFEKLLSIINLEKEDSLFLLGDYINRGPHNKKVIDLIINLIETGYRLFPLRGNHEQMLIDAETSFRNSRFIFPGIKKPYDLYDKNDHLTNIYRDFIFSLPYYYEIEQFYLVHAGFNTMIQDPFNDTDSMIWSDVFNYDSVKLKNKKVIHGHTSYPLNEIMMRISDGSNILPLDNGVNETAVSGFGSLVCLNINKMELQILQKSAKDK